MSKQQRLIAAGAIVGILLVIALWVNFGGGGGEPVEDELAERAGEIQAGIESAGGGAPPPPPEPLPPPPGITDARRGPPPQR